MQPIINVITRYILTYEFTLRIDPTFHPLESEHNKAEVIERAGRIFKRWTLTWQTTTHKGDIPHSCGCY